MADKWLKARDEQLPRCVPDLFDHRSLLYVGAKLRWNYPTFRGQDLFDKAGYEIDIIELSPANAAALRRINKNGHKFRNGFKGPGMFRKIIQGDVRDVDQLTKDTYDVVMWWQGPEHVYLDEVKPTVKKLLAITRKLILMGCPCWTESLEHPMAAMEKYKGSTSAHFSILSPGFFEEMGFETDVVGIPGKKGNNMAVWRRP
jgi:hypothetical protein